MQTFKLFFIESYRLVAHIQKSLTFCMQLTFKCIQRRVRVLTFNIVAVIGCAVLRFLRKCFAGAKAVNFERAPFCLRFNFSNPTNLCCISLNSYYGSRVFSVACVFKFFLKLHLFLVLYIAVQVKISTVCGVYTHLTLWQCVVPILCAQLRSLVLYFLS